MEMTTGTTLCGFCKEREYGVAIPLTSLPTAEGKTKVLPTAVHVFICEGCIEKMRLLAKQKKTSNQIEGMDGG